MRCSPATCRLTTYRQPLADAPGGGGALAARRPVGWVPAGGAAPGGTLLAAGGDNHHFSFSLAVVGEKLTGKSALITCTRPPEQRDVGADTPDPMADHGVRCHAHIEAFLAHALEAPPGPVVL